MASADFRSRQRPPSETALETRKVRFWPAFALLPIIVVVQARTTGLVSIGGVATTVLSVFVLFFAALTTFYRYPRYPVRQMGPFLLFALVVLMAVVRSDGGEYQAIKARDSFLTFLVALCLPILLRDLRDLRGFLLVWFYGGVLVAVLVFIVGSSETLYGRAGLGEETLGPAYLSAAALVVGAAGLGERIMPVPIALPGIVVSGVALVGIGSRGPMIAAGLGVLTWFLLSGVLRVRSLAVLALAFGVALLGINQASEAALSRFVLEDPARSYLWETAQAAFLEVPYFGLGWGNFATISDFRYPHNLFLETAIELGLLGLLVLGFLLLVVLSRVLRGRSVPEVRVVASLAVVWTIGQQFSTDLTNRLFWISLVPCLLIPVLVRKGSTLTYSRQKHADSGL